MRLGLGERRMKKMFSVVLFCFLPACVTAEKDDRICIDFGSFTYVREKCTPLYGSLICMDEQVTEVYCKLYDEEPKPE